MSRGLQRLDLHSQSRAPGRGGAGGGSSWGGPWLRVLGYPRRWSGWPERPLPSGEAPSWHGHAPGLPADAAPAPGPGTAAADGRCAWLLCKSPVPPRGDAPPLGSGQRPSRAARLCKVAIRVTLDHPSEQAGGPSAGSGPASRRGRAGRAGRAFFLVAGSRGFRCSGPLRTDLLTGLCNAVGVQLRCARVFPSSVSGERRVQAARGCEGVPRAVA